MRDYSKQVERIRSSPDPAVWLKPSRYWKGGGKPQYAQFDFETFSNVDIGKGGAYKYIRSKAFEPLLLAVAFDDEEVFCIDLASGEEVPDIVWAAVFDDEIVKTAWNAQFERGIFGRMAGCVLSPNSWRCTMVWAASLSLPLKLKNAAKVLKTGEQKDRSGEALIRKFSVPRTPTPTDPRTQVMPADDPEGWRQFKDYCLQDVRTERDIRKRLEAFPLPDREWDVYHLDQRINDRGVLVDMDLVEKAIECDLGISDALTKRAYELTGLENPNSVSQLKMWLEQRGIETPSLGKKEVSALIADLDRNGCDQEALDMLKLRQMSAKSSVKKYQAAERCACDDGRARGLFQFYGANRTGRWSGRNLQLQNLPQNHIETLDEARELVKAGAFEMLAMLYGNVPDILSQLIRTMLIPKEGCQFIVADFSAIEARVLAWESGEQWRLDAFSKGEDIYCASASQMFGVPVVKHGVNGELRQKGKVAELACIAEDSLVLTDQGLIPIQDVTVEHLLWDGEEWVRHEGVIEKGERDVITYEGLTATFDHLVFVEGKPEPLQFGDAAASGAHLIQTGDGGQAIRVGENHQPGETVGQELECLLCADRVSGLRCCTVDDSEQLNTRNLEGMPKLFRGTETDSTLAGQASHGGEAEMRESKRSGLQELWGQGNKVRLSECDGSRTFFDGGIRNTKPCDGDRPDRYKRELRSGKSSIRHKSSKLRKSQEYGSFKIRSGMLALREVGCDTKTLGGTIERRNHTRCGDCCIRETEELAGHSSKVKVYDIRNAGRHHRFTVSGKLVHNCGYQGGVGALISMGALDMGLKESELPDIIEQWRGASPHIVQYWWDMQDAAIQTVKDHNERRVQRILFQFYSGTLWIVLPSGRRLAYLKPRIQPNRFGHMALTFEGNSSTESAASGNWGRQETYGGKLVENCTQAIARDILAEAMLRMEKAGLRIVAHVHDEVIIEAPIGKYTVEDVCQLMAVNPGWCADLPMAAAGYSGLYYFKD